MKAKRPSTALGTLAFGLAIWLGMACGVHADDAEGTPMAAVKESTERILAVLRDSAYAKDGEKAGQRRAAIRVIADQRFDWETMARKSLARYWRDLTDAKKKEFTVLFADLLDGAYMDRIESYSGQAVTYKDERLDGETEAEVTVVIVTNAEGEFDIVYHLHKPVDRWLVRDVNVAGVSLVNNYRRQFRSLLGRMSIDKMMERMRSKVSLQDDKD